MNLWKLIVIVGLISFFLFCVSINGNQYIEGIRSKVNGNFLEIYPQGYCYWLIPVNATKEDYKVTVYGKGEFYLGYWTHHHWNRIGPYNNVGSFYSDDGYVKVWNLSDEMITIYSINIE